MESQIFENSTTRIITDMSAVNYIIFIEHESMAMDEISQIWQIFDMLTIVLNQCIILNQLFVH